MSIPRDPAIDSTLSILRDGYNFIWKITAEQWRLAVARWEHSAEVVLFDEAQRVLTASVCQWAGVPLLAHDLPTRARDLGKMVDAFGGVGPRLWQGKLARVRTQRWLIRLIEDVRAKQVVPRAGSALDVMARHRDADGRLLTPKTAAVELINVIRPTAAIAWYITFAALALHQHPEARAQLLAEPLGGDAGEYADRFMQEVRRFYPFTPFLGAMVRKEFVWQGHTFTPGTLVLLDVHGTNHDPSLWSDPQSFRPERFRDWAGSAFDFIPQGGGSPQHGHRCPGEWITMHNVTLALHFLCRCMSYEVAPGQDLSFDLARMPTRPRSGFVIRAVRANARLAEPAPRLPSGFAARDGRAASAHGPAAHANVSPTA